MPYLMILTGHGELTGTLLLTEAEGSSEVGAIEKICLALSKKERPVLRSGRLCQGDDALGPCRDVAAV